MWRQTPARSVLYLLSAEYSVVMCGAWPGTLVTVASYQYDILFCSETLISDTRHMSKLLVPSFSCCVGARCLWPVGWLHTYEMVMERITNLNLSEVVAKCCFLVFVL